MTLHTSARKDLASIHNYQPGKPIEEVEREYGVKNAIKMASNENALGPSPKALKAVMKRLSGVHRYPDGGCYYLRQRLAEKLSLAPNELIFGNGSDEILVLAVRAFVEAGDEIVIADPTFLIYEIAAQLERAQVTKVPVVNFHYDLESMARKISPRTKIVFIANPDNPIGTYISNNDLVGFLEQVPTETLVVLDEAYYEYGKLNRDYPNSLSLLKAYRNLLVVRTFSKVYGLAGLRVGYAFAEASIVNALNKVREPFNVNMLAQEAALAALDDKAHLKKSLALIKTERRYLYKSLQKMGLNAVETATNFILVDVIKDAQWVHESLMRRGVIVRPMGVWGLKTFIRVTIGRRSENIHFIQNLKKILQDGDQKQ